MSLKHILARKGFRQFLIRSVILIVFLIFLQFLSMPFIEKIKIPQEIYTVQYTVIGVVLIFSYIIFLFLVKDRLDNFKTFKFNIKGFAIFYTLGLFFYFLFFYSKYMVSQNLEFAINNIIIILTGRHLILLLSLISFAIAIFSLRQICYISKTFRKEVIISAIVTAIFTTFSLAVQNTWKFLSFAITKAVYLLLSLTFENIMLIDNETISTGKFTVNIGKVCSGIESILLFTTLYLFVFFLDRKKLNKKRMFLIYIPGLIGVFLVNILRVYLILLIGMFYSIEFAVGIFHTNAGWLFFIAYFLIFWWFAYPWVKN